MCFVVGHCASAVSLRLHDASNRDFGDVLTVSAFSIDAWDETTEALTKYQLAARGPLDTHAVILSVAQHRSSIRTHFARSDCIGDPLVEINGHLLNTILVDDRTGRVLKVVAENVTIGDGTKSHRQLVIRTEKTFFGSQSKPIEQRCYNYAHPETNWRLLLDVTHAMHNPLFPLRLERK
jgi:hypothetical protein